MSGIIGKKIGMTAIYDSGHRIACTLIQAGPCTVTQIREIEKDGYRATQLAYEDKKTKNTTKPLQGHFKKAQTTPKRKLVEFLNLIQDHAGSQIQLGATIKVQDIFQEGDKANVTAFSKGKGFQGVVKRHGFKGVNDRTHGQHNRERAPGSIGAGTTPGHVFKGTRMAGRMGGNRIKVKNLKIMKIMPEHNLLLISGAVPGPQNGYIILEK